MNHINWESWRHAAKAQHDRTSENGYWINTTVGEHIAYLHSEVSELFEAYRKGPNNPCDKDIDLTAEEEEMADIYLILLDLAHERHINLADAARKKFEYNFMRKNKLPPRI